MLNYLKMSIYHFSEYYDIFSSFYVTVEVNIFAMKDFTNYFVSKIGIGAKEYFRFYPLISILVPS